MRRQFGTSSPTHGGRRRKVIAPQTEHYPMSKINEAFVRLESAKSRYRMVLDADF